MYLPVSIRFSQRPSRRVVADVQVYNSPSVTGRLYRLVELPIVLICQENNSLAVRDLLHSLNFVNKRH